MSQAKLSILNTLHPAHPPIHTGKWATLPVSIMVDENHYPHNDQTRNLGIMLDSFFSLHVQSIIKSSQFCLSKILKCLYFISSLLVQSIIVSLLNYYSSFLTVFVTSSLSFSYQFSISRPRNHSKYRYGQFISLLKTIQNNHCFENKVQHLIWPIGPSLLWSLLIPLVSPLILSLRPQ